jgi:hypothetical protein
MEELLGYNLRIILAYLMKEDFDPFGHIGVVIGLANF